jgi:plastocyanin
MTTRQRLAGLAAVMCAAPLLLGACSSGDDDNTATDASDSSSTSSSAAVNTGPTVEVTEFAYSPSAEEVTAGETLTWKNEGTANHTVTPEKSADGSSPFESTQLEPGETFVQTFNTPGTYAYFCSIHPDRMSGSIVVAAAG